METCADISDLDHVMSDGSPTTSTHDFEFLTRQQHSRDTSFCRPQRADKSKINLMRTTKAIFISFSKLYSLLRTACPIYTDQSNEKTTLPTRHYFKHILGSNRDGLCANLSRGRRLRGRSSVCPHAANSSTNHSHFLRRATVGFIHKPWDHTLPSGYLSRNYVAIAAFRQIRSRRVNIAFRNIGAFHGRQQ